MNKTAIAAVVATACALAMSGCSSSSDDAAPGPTGPAKVTPPAILQAGSLKICAPNDGTPPNVYHDESGELVGSEVDLGRALASQMGLKADFVQSAFASVIPTLQAKQCDVIMAQLYIKPEREAVVDFVPYVLSGTGIAVSQGAPSGHHRHERHPVRQEGDGRRRYHCRVTVSGAGRKSAPQHGKPTIDINRNNHADVSLQQVQNGQMDAYLDTAETLGYYATKTGARIQMAGDPFGTIQIGAATLKGNTELHNAIAQALGDLEANGTYTKILDQWGQTDLSIKQ